jgi:hypothetical protein
VCFSLSGGMHEIVVTDNAVLRVPVVETDKK